jgi:eukaryotic-like serine/threonine-protein kinase
MVAKLFLTVLSGPMQGKVFEFTRHDTFIFGRGTGCHATLPGDSGVSRHHFLLEMNPPRAIIRDLGSMNGTHVNGVCYGGRKKTDAGSRPRLSQTWLEHGDKITVGNTTILVQIEQPMSNWDPEYIMPLAYGSFSKSDPSAPASLPITAKAAKANELLLSRSSGPSEKAPKEAANLPAANGAQLADGATGAIRQSPDANANDGIEAAVRKGIEDPQIKPLVEITGYRLEDKIGEGSMGTVYAGIRLQDKLPVAVKVMMPKIAAADRIRSRFLREIDVLRTLSHPNIVTLLDSGTVEKAFFFVVEFCNGGNLADLTDRCGGKVPLDILRPIMSQTLAGLDHAHRQGLVHRDLKPQNILLHQFGAGWVGKLSDFGIAKQYEQAGFSGMTLTVTFGGTFDFMPREQITNFKGFKPVSDVWSIAATFYRAITGKSPRNCPQDRDPMEVVLCERPVPIRKRDPGIPPALAAVIDKALAFEPRDRFQDAGAMQKAFSEALASP